MQVWRAVLTATAVVSVAGVFSGGGAAEAMGEVLAVRTELQGEFLPKLAELISDDEKPKSPEVERGGIWALGRLGKVVSSAAPEAVFMVEILAKEHPDEETRALAAKALPAIKA